MTGRYTMLRTIIEADIRRGGETSSSMVRAGLLLHLLDSHDELVEALEVAGEAIASLPEDALGYGAPAFCTPEEARASQWPLKGELLAKIDTALSHARSTDRGDER